MSTLNIYERLPIYKLQELIGDQQLDEVQKVLEALNIENLDAGLILTRGFLASYAKATLNIKYLFSTEGARVLLGTLNDDEIEQLSITLGLEVYDSRSHFLDSIVRIIKKKENRKVIANFLGFKEYLELDSEVIALPAEINFEASQVPYKPLK